MATREGRLAQTFVGLADNLVESFDVVELLSHLGEECIDLFDAAAAGVLLADGQGILRLMAATSEAMEMVELFQLQNAEGPCLDCYRSGKAVQVEDLSAAAWRWPLFVPVAVDAGFGSAQALPLRLRGRVLGAMNLFGAGPGSLAPLDVAAAQAMADVATIAILQHRSAQDARILTDQLHTALDSRILIEQAKGVIAEQAGLEMDRAFALLRGYARRNGRQLALVAEDIIERRIDARSLTP